MRILDFLHHDDGGDGDGDNDHMMDFNKGRSRTGAELAVSPSPPSRASSSVASSSSASTSTAAASPRSLLSRWLLPFRKPSPGGGGGEGSPRWNLRRKKKKGEEADELEEGGEVVGPPVPEPPPASAGGGPGVPPPESSSQGGGVAGNQESCAEHSAPSGPNPEAVSFNLGMEACVVLLLARSATEFSKMIELQRQMKTLLKEIKDEVRRKVTVPIFSESNNNFAFSASDYCHDLNSSKKLSLQNNRGSLDQDGAECVIVSNGQSYNVTKFGNRRCPKMDQLEAEVEIELERLQFNLKGEDSSALPGPCQMELAGENTDPSGCFSLSCGEDKERNEDQREMHGVNAWELERRLHELLETRQRARIAELESTVVCTERRLREKEIEASWWRDIATDSSES